MEKELLRKGLMVQRQVKLPIVYKTEILDKEFYLDLLVENEIIVELKSVETLLPIHEAQLITYLKLANKRLGLLINFNVVLLKDGIKRRINGNII